MHACMDGCMYVRTYVCMYVCMYVYVYIYIYTYLEPPSSQISVGEPDFQAKPKKQKTNLSGIDMTPILRCFF